MKNNTMSKKILLITAVFMLTFVLGIGLLSLLPNALTNIRQVNAETISGEESFIFDNTSGKIIGVTPEVRDLPSVDLIIPTTINGDAVTGIGANAFKDWAGLTSITIPEGITTIGSKAFYETTNLTAINYYAASVTDLLGGDQAFYKSGRSGTGINVNFGANVTKVPAFMFHNTITQDAANIKTVNFAEGSALTSIGNYAFYNCNALIEIAIPSGSIGNYAFNGCNALKTLTIFPNVTSIGNNAFYGCSGLTVINFNATSLDDMADNKNCFAFAGTSGIGITVNIGANVTKIPANLFCPKYNETIQIPKILKVNFAEESVCTTIGLRAFQGCNKMTSINIPQSVTSIGGNAFSQCSGLTNLTIPSNVTVIGAYAFQDCYGLENLTIESDITSISNNMLENCYGLTSFIIPSSVTSIDSNAFRGCTGLATIAFPENVTIINNYAFSDCTGLTDIAIPSKVTDVGDFAFYNCINLTSISISDGLAGIGSHAFGNCASLVGIIIPASVTNIASNTFHGCSSLTIFAEVEEDSRPEGWAVDWNSSGRPVIWGFSNQITLTLDYNYGDTANGTQIVEFNTDYEIEVPVRKYYTFIGWFSEPTGGIQYTDDGGVGLDIWSEPINRTLYAKWELISAQYNVTNSIVETDGNEILSDSAALKVFDGQGEEIETIILNQEGYLTAYFHANYTNEAFKNWMVQRNDGNTFDNLGFGVSVTATSGRDAEQRLDLYSDSVYIINEEFLDNYLQVNDEIIFKAVYTIFGAQQYTLNTKAVNMINEVIEDISVSSASTTLNFLEYFNIEKDSSADYEFIGWYAKIGNGYVLFDDFDRDLFNIQVNEDFVKDYADGYEINMVARFVRNYSAEISSTSGGEIKEIEVIEGGAAITEGMYKENTVLKITFAADNFYCLDGIDGVYETENIEADYVLIKIDDDRAISLNFIPKVFTVESNNNLSKASGKIDTPNQLSLYDEVVITFDADLGHKVSKWMLNGMTVSEINARYNDVNAVEKGNTITFTVTEAWLVDHESKLNNTITTELDSDNIMLIIAVGVAALLLLVGIVLMLRANKKRKLSL